MIVYIMGPMSGLYNENKDSFFIVEELLIRMGHEVRNPAHHPAGWAYEDYLEVDLVMLGQCDAFVCLPGSEHSKGVAIEKESAEKNNIPDRTEELMGYFQDVLEVLYGKNSTTGS